MEQLSKEIKELDVKIVNVELRLTEKINDSKNTTIKWVAGLMFAQIVTLGGLFFTAFKIFMPH